MGIAPPALDLPVVFADGADMPRVIVSPGVDLEEAGGRERVDDRNMVITPAPHVAVRLLDATQFDCGRRDVDERDVCW